MKRRDFISTTGLLTAGIGALATIGCNDHAGNQEPAAGGMKDTATTANTDDRISAPSIEIAEMSVDQLQAGMASGKYTSQALVTMYLKRMDAIDAAGPHLGSVIERNPDALKIAGELDQERKAGKIRGPLHGIPVLIKDNIDTADAMQTTAGSLAMMGNKPSGDAFVVKQLRAAGAVIIGKTNLSEWANFRSSQSTSGWSSRGGQTRNPYVLDHNPCGSSSGSGVAVSANLCAIAVGTETDGSVTCPASVNGIVGIKPTVGVVSRTGIIPISSTQDTAGPMARTVRDAALLLGVLAGEDPNDAITADNMVTSKADYTAFLDPNALRGKRIGVEKKPPGNNQFMHALQAQALEVIRKQGAVVVEIDYLDDIGKLGGAEFEVMLFEFKDGLNKYLAAANAPVKTLAGVIAWNSQHQDKAMPYFKQETMEAAEKKAGLDSAAYKEALHKSRDGARRIIDSVMQKYSLDAITGLTMGPACSTDNIYGDRWGDVFLTAPAAMSGYPHISVPAGMVYGLPVGLSFFGRAYTEGPLIAIAYAFEQATKHRRQPQFIRTLAV